MVQVSVAYNIVKLMNWTFVNLKSVNVFMVLLQIFGEMRALAWLLAAGVMAAWLPLPTDTISDTTNHDHSHLVVRKGWA